MQIGVRVCMRVRVSGGDLLANSLEVTLSLNESEVICLHIVECFQLFQTLIITI